MGKCSPTAGPAVSSELGGEELPRQERSTAAAAAASLLCPWEPLQPPHSLCSAAPPPPSVKVVDISPNYTASRLCH